jgi:hypothetical protein
VLDLSAQQIRQQSNMTKMTLSELRSLSFLLGQAFLDLENNSRPVAADTMRDANYLIIQEIGKRERFNEKTLSE